jgi:hypothetical protein
MEYCPVCGKEIDSMVGVKGRCLNDVKVQMRKRMGLSGPE